MANPLWYTESGSIGTYKSSYPVYVQLSAAPAAPAVSVTYSIVSGTLPTGVTMNSNGLIQGSSTSLGYNSFSVAATDNLGNKSIRIFNITIGYAPPNWSTPAGNLGSFPSNVSVYYQFSASVVYPALTLTYTLLSGTLPPGLSLNINGLLTGTPDSVYENTDYTFVIRATDNVQNVSDRTFTMTISGIDAPKFVTPSGIIVSTLDSTWVEYPIDYTIPVSGTDIIIRNVAGSLPPGLEINEYGLIRGYAEPPVLNESLGQVTTSAISTNSNNIFVYSLTGFSVGRPIIFSGAVFGGIVSGKTYYVKSIDISNTSFTISVTSGGSILTLDDAVGFMDVTLPNITVGVPVVKTYNFTLKLYSDYGTDLQNYSITVINQNASFANGGPNLLPNTRIPSILNTRPLSYDIYSNNMDYIFYLFPPNSQGETYSPTIPAYIGRINSDNKFNFQVLGHDFDGNELEYIFVDLPSGLTGDSKTGWISGNPIIAPDTISQFIFKVCVRKKINTAIQSAYFTFSFNIINGVNGDVNWITPTNLGTVLNGTTSILAIQAESDVPLQYELLSGTLPPNLTLLSSGELSGVISYQPGTSLTLPYGSNTFTFTVRAYSPDFAPVTSTATFTLTVYNFFAYPTDTLYIKCTPGINDRNLLATLLNDDSLIPPEYLYRKDDPYFGKANNVTYVHAYGIYASDFEDYISAVTINHYWRHLTLGELKTAIAKDNNGNIIYEVVYSSVIDNLINPEGISVSKQIIWPRYIPLNLGPYYTSETDIYTSYEGENSPPPSYYTSLTPGFVRDLYPNSLPNMREQVADVLGQEQNTNLLPLWMTSQQKNGSTTGFIPAWVICYTKPGYADIIKNNIETQWKNQVGQIQTLNEIDFKIDRFTVNKSNTYNYDNNLNPPSFTSLPGADPVPDPIDSKDFYVLFPRKTILPSSTNNQI